MNDEPLGVATTSIAWGLVVTVAAYAAKRAFEVAAFPHPNPAAFTWSVHSGFFWRVLTVSYAGGMATLIAFLLVRRSFASATRALGPAIAITAVVLVIQSLFAP